ncbi:MAG: CHRD domain-containing protein [Mycobacterium sp.]
MSPSIRRSLGLLLALALFLALLPGTAAAAARTVGGTTFLATVMIGAEEAPKPGDPDGIGAVALALKASSGQVCWAYTVRRVDPITAAHIHLASPGAPGDVVVPLGASGARSFSIGCTKVDPAIVAAIVANPDAYYVNVHSAIFPDGALRGQLD